MAFIYKITSPSGKIYIGQTWDWNSRKRNYIRLECKEQRKLYNSLRKYNPESHVMEIIHELPKDTTQEILDNYENLYWRQYKDCGFEMMNIKEPLGNRGRHSEETKQKMSKPKPEGFGAKISNIRKGMKFTLETCSKISKSKKGHPCFLKPKKEYRSKGKPFKTKRSLVNLKKAKCKPIIQYDLNMNIVKEWESASDAAKILNLNQPNIHFCLNNLNRTYKKYIWRYK